MANELATRSNTNLPGFQSAEGFELLQRQVKMFTLSRVSKIWVMLLSH